MFSFLISLLVAMSFQSAQARVLGGVVYGQNESNQEMSTPGISLTASSKKSTTYGLNLDYSGWRWGIGFHLLSLTMGASQYEANSDTRTTYTFPYLTGVATIVWWPQKFVGLGGGMYYSKSNGNVQTTVYAEGRTWGDRSEGFEEAGYKSYDYGLVFRGSGRLFLDKIYFGLDALYLQGMVNLYKEGNAKLTNTAILYLAAVGKQF